MAHYRRSHLAFNDSTEDDSDVVPPPGYTSPNIPPSLRPAVASPRIGHLSSYEPGDGLRRPYGEQLPPGQAQSTARFLYGNTRQTPHSSQRSHGNNTRSIHETDNANEADAEGNAENSGSIRGDGSDSDLSLPVAVSHFLELGASEDRAFVGATARSSRIAPSYRSIASTRNSEHSHRQDSAFGNAGSDPVCDKTNSISRGHTRTHAHGRSRTESMRSRGSHASASRHYRHSHAGHVNPTSSRHGSQRKSQHQRNSSQPHQNPLVFSNDRVDQTHNPNSSPKYATSSSASRTCLPIHAHGQSIQSHETHLLPPPLPPLPSVLSELSTHASAISIPVTKPVPPFLSESHSSLKLSPTNHVSLSRKTRPESNGIFSLRKVSASIKGTFTVNPYLHIPSALLAPQSDRASIVTSGPRDSTARDYAKRKNLLLHAENGGIDVDLVLVGNQVFDTEASNALSKIEKTTLELKLIPAESAASKMHSLIARVRTPHAVRPPFQLQLSGSDGYVAAQIPESFQGLVTIRVNSGNLNAHVSLSRMFTDNSIILSETSTTRSFFLGEFGRWGSNEEEWNGDSVEVCVNQGKVRLQLAGEKNWDRLRKMTWRIFGF